MRRQFIMRTCNVCGREYKANKQHGRVFRSPCKWCGAEDYAQGKMGRGRLLFPEWEKEPEKEKKYRKAW